MHYVFELRKNRVISLDVFETWAESFKHAVIKAGRIGIDTDAAEAGLTTRLNCSVMDNDEVATIQMLSKVGSL